MPASSTPTRLVVPTGMSASLRSCAVSRIGCRRAAQTSGVITRNSSPGIRGTSARPPVLSSTWSRRRSWHMDRNPYRTGRSECSTRHAESAGLPSRSSRGWGASSPCGSAAKMSTGGVRSAHVPMRCCGASMSRCAMPTRFSSMVFRTSPSPTRLPSRPSECHGFP